jgi:hypothetical protein
MHLVREVWRLEMAGKFVVMVDDSRDESDNGDDDNDDNDDDHEDDHDDNYDDNHDDVRRMRRFVASRCLILADIGGRRGLDA